MNNLYQDIVFETVINNERTCYLLLAALQSKGVTFSVELETLNHQQMIEAVRAIMDELAKKELH